MRSVFITGSNGLLGHNLILELVHNDYDVKALLRDKTKYVGEQFEQLELIEGTLFEDYSEAMSNCYAVVHVAAETRQNILHYSDYQRINIEATTHLLKAAIEAKCKKFVFISTANTIGSIHPAKELHSETAPFGYPFTKSHYARSKKEAEDQILTYQDQIDIIILNPTFILGAYDTKPSSGRILKFAVGKPFLFYPTGGKNFVYARDVAQGIIRAIECGKNGEKYLLCNENFSFKAFYQKVNQKLKKNPLLLKIPIWLTSVIGELGSFMRKFGVPTEINRVNMDMLSHQIFYSNEKSVQELGLNYHTLDEYLDEILNDINY